MVSATLPLSVEEIELLQQQLQIYKDALLNTTLTVHEFDTGDTAWVLTSTALILFMTLPGLILYYIGMIRVQNVLTTAMHVFSIACVITACWFFLGYSLAFAPVGTERESSPVYGDATRGFLFGVHADTFHQLAPTIPEPIFCAFQLTFAIITPALIWGSLADRMKYESLLAFIVFWHFLVYCPVAHSTWHPDGFLYKAGVLDFAGGLVVHLSAGISGLVTTIILKPRIGLGSKKEDNDPMLLPHNIPLTICGSCMLWVGWFGFNAGSALHANGLASVAFLNTFISAGFATLSWLVVEFAFSKHSSALGMVNGAISGLVCITPASGYVTTLGAFFIGLIGGVACYGGSQIKYFFKIDDSLDAFGVHAVGGFVGTIVTAFFANKNVGGEDGIFYTNTATGGRQLAKQLYAVVVVSCWAGFASFVILKILELVMGGLRVSEAVEKNADKLVLREDAHPNTEIPLPQMPGIHPDPLHHDI